MVCQAPVSPYVCGGERGEGGYDLDLAVAADRVVAVQLADLMELDRAAEKDLLRGITVDG